MVLIFFHAILALSCFEILTSLQMFIELLLVSGLTFMLFNFVKLSI